MRTLLCLVLSTLGATSAAGADDAKQVASPATYRADLATRVDRLVERELDNLLALYKDLHAHPELSLQEKQSAARMARLFEEYGYVTTPGVGGHGVVGVLANGPGPTVLIRGDMDALPVTEETELPYRSRVKVPGPDGRPVGVMHACGHDIHQTYLIGTAKLLAELRDSWSGTVMLIAQPAEEIGQGARMMIEDGLFERFGRPDFCLSIHVAGDQPAGEIGYTSGWAMANVDSVDITIYGRGGHGSRPSQTVDPVVTAAHLIVALQTVVSRRLDPIQPGVVTVGSVHSGSKHNIIPDEAQLQLTVRSYTDETRKVLLDGIREIAIHTCRAMGCPREPLVLVREDDFTPAAYNDPTLAAALAGVMGEVIGRENVVEIPARMGGEDFGRYGRHLNVPSFLFWLGSVSKERFEASRQPGGPPLPALHSANYLPDPVPTIRTGVRCMTANALALLATRE